MSRRTALALATVYVVWGSTFLAIKVAIETIPPLLMAGGRFLLAGAVLYPFVARAARPSGRQWGSAAVSGGLLLVVGNGAVTVAEQWLDSGIAALLVATVPLWMTLLGRVVEGDRLPLAGVVGLVTGFVGVALLVGPDSVPLGPALIVIVGTLGWAAGSLASRRMDLPATPLATAAMQMLAGGVIFLILGVAAGEPGRFDLAAVTPASIVALLYLAAFGSLLAYSAYGWLLKNASMSLTGTYAYVNPVIAVVLGALFLDERIDVRTIVAGGVIVIAVAVIVASRRPARPPPPPAVAPAPPRGRDIDPVGPVGCTST